MIEDVYLWHLNFPEERNWLEAEYISFIINLARKITGKKYMKILDIPCGIGRHHKYLRENGFEVFGIDNNENLIKIAKERNKGYEKYYEVKDMREIDFKGEFDVVLNWFSSFGYFDHEENMDVLKRFYKALRKGGILILDFPVILFEGMEVKDYGEYVEILKTIRVDRSRYLFDIKLYKKEGNDLRFVNENKVKIIGYTPKELKKAFEKIGFKLLFAFANRGIKDVKDILDKYEPLELLNNRIYRIEWVLQKS